MRFPDQAIPISSREVQTIGNYRYPSTPSAHSMVFIFRDYSYNGTRGLIRPQSTTSIAASVLLPLAENIQDSYNVNINSAELGALPQLGLDAATNDVDSISRDIERLGGSSEGEAATFASQAGRASRYLSRAILDALPGNAGSAIDVGTGTTVNPHIALQFEGMNLKDHSFTWTLSPKNEQEAKDIRDMIRFIKTRMLPSYGVAGAESAIGRSLLRYPSLVEIYFVGVDQSYFLFYKPGFVKNMSLNYTPNGVALNKGGRPSIITMQLDIGEARIHTREDYQGDG